MTAVACLKIKTHPLVFADLLISAPAIPSTTVNLPSVEVRYAPDTPDTHRGPKALRQKIAIIADNVVIGWAGTYGAAADVVSDLRELSEHECLNPRLVAECLRRQRRSIWNDLQVAGFILNTDIDELTSFRSKNCQAIDSPAFGEVVLLGSGGDMLSELFKGEIGSPRIPDDPENLAIQAVAYGMALIGNYLTYEQFSCANLDNRFGGGYELATLSYEKFVKLSDVLYVFWRATLSPDHKSVNLKAFPFLLFRYEYYGDLLVLRCIRLKERDGQADGNEQVFLIPPVYRYLSAEEKSNPPLPQFSAQWICNYVQVFPQPDKMNIMTLAAHAKGGKWFQFTEVNGLLTNIGVAELLYQDVLQGIERKYCNLVEADLEKR